MPRPLILLRLVPRAAVLALDSLESSCLGLQPVPVALGLNVSSMLVNHTPRDQIDRRTVAQLGNQGRPACRDHWHAGAAAQGARASRSGAVPANMVRSDRFVVKTHQLCPVLSAQTGSVLALALPSIDVRFEDNGVVLLRSPR